MSKTVCEFSTSFLHCRNCRKIVERLSKTSYARKARLTANILTRCWVFNFSTRLTISTISVYMYCNNNRNSCSHEHTDAVTSGRRCATGQQTHVADASLGAAGKARQQRACVPLLLSKAIPLTLSCQQATIVAKHRNMAERGRRREKAASIIARKVRTTVNVQTRILTSILGRVLPLQANALAFGKREMNAGLFK